MIRKYLYISIVAISSLWFSACNNLEDSAMTIKPSEESLILSETFETSFGKFSTYNVSGDQIWTIDSRAYAGMSGYVVATKTNYANEDWLISPEIDLTNVTESYVTFDYVAHLMGDISQESTLWISENYITDSLPSKATWVQFPVKILPDPGNYVFSSCGQVSLNSFAGKKIKIAFKYVSTATKGGTWEIKNFQVKKGIAFNKDNGKGTELLPYNLAGAFANQGSAGAVSACVRGYIVGYLWSGTSTNFIFSSDTCTQATNILIADTVNGLYLSKCMPVQLPIGAVRTALNLQANKTLIGKKVTLYGTLESYFGSPGLKNVSYYILPDGTTGGVKPVEAIYSETFMPSRQGSFTVNNVLLPAGFSSVWTTSPSFGMVATGFKNPTNNAAEGWLISPNISLEGQTSAKLRFEHAINFVIAGNITTEMTLWISEDNGSNWTKLTIPTYPPGNTWNFTSSGEINLSPYLGKTIKIAFKYLSTATKAGTWEVRNFVVYK